MTGTDLSIITISLQFGGRLGCFPGAGLMRRFAPNVYKGDKARVGKLCWKLE
jgi:hypothetical protein